MTQDNLTEVVANADYFARLLQVAVVADSLKNNPTLAALMNQLFKERLRNIDALKTGWSYKSVEIDFAGRTTIEKTPHQDGGDGFSIYVDELYGRDLMRNIERWMRDEFMTADRPHTPVNVVFYETDPTSTVVVEAWLYEDIYALSSGTDYVCAHVNDRALSKVSYQLPFGAQHMTYNDRALDVAQAILNQNLISPSSEVL